MTQALRFAAIGIDHRHVYGMAANMIDAGAEFAGWWTDGHPHTEKGFLERFTGVPRTESAEVLLNDPSIDFVMLAGIPRDRAGWAIAAMEAGKDVLTDKPGCTTRRQLRAIRHAAETTHRIWSIDFSERFEVPAATRAAELVADGAIGRVVQTIGIGPHRLNRATRPGWFFDRDAYGGILTDLASHQIDSVPVLHRQR